MSVVVPPSHRIMITEFTEALHRPRPEPNVCQLRFLPGTGVVSIGTVQTTLLGHSRARTTTETTVRRSFCMRPSTTLGSPLAWKPFWSACGRRFGIRFAKRHELKGSDDCDGSRPDFGAPRNRMTGSTIMVNSEALTSQFGCSFRPGRSAWRRRTRDVMRASHELQGAVGARPCNRPPALAVVVAHCVASSVGEYSSLASTH